MEVKVQFDGYIVDSVDGFGFAHHGWNALRESLVGSCERKGLVEPLRLNLESCCHLSSSRSVVKDAAVTTPKAPDERFSSHLKPAGGLPVQQIEPILAKLLLHVGKVVEICAGQQVEIPA